MQDISSPLRRAAADARHWSDDDVRIALAAVVGGAPSRTVDWDTGAGEEWGRVLEQGEVVGLVSARLPLAITRSWRLPDVEVIDVDDFEAAALCAEAGALSEAFPELAALLASDSSLLDLGAFSALDLWFLTV
jgi:hypothetical protein